MFCGAAPVFPPSCARAHTKFAKPQGKIITVQEKNLIKFAFSYHHNVHFLSHILKLYLLLHRWNHVTPTGDSRLLFVCFMCDY